MNNNPLTKHNSVFLQRYKLNKAIKGYRFLKNTSIAGMICSFLAPAWLLFKNLMNHGHFILPIQNYLRMFLVFLIPWMLIFLLCSYRIRRMKHEKNLKLK